jgi:peptidyl-prolyl cis-trans isomerase D
MAIIQSIRTRAGLLLTIIVGVALFAFVLGDFLTRGGIMSNKSKMTVAVINGTSILYPEFQKELADVEDVMKAENQLNSLTNEMLETARNQVWQQMLQKYLLDREYAKIGLALTNAEFMDMIQGQNPHPLIMRMFHNPETGAFDRLRLSEFINRIDEVTGVQKKFWKYAEDYITNERLLNKYNTLIEKGLYANKLETERRQKELNTSVDFSFIEKKYTDISDSGIVVKESELKKYYKENIARYKQDESRDLKYVAFDVVPSQADYNEAKEWINNILPEFKEVEDVEQYINYNSPPYDETNYKKGELPDSLDEFMFNAKLGDVYGPYFENNTFKLAKLAKINYLPDSVRVSHILLPVNQNNVQQMRSLADSLVKLARQGYDFGELVAQNSHDQTTRMLKGDMGWIKEGENGQYFSDSCFYSKVGDVKLTYNDQGLQIIKITAESKPVKKVQAGILTREVAPGSQTDQLYYSKAVDFASKNNSPEKFEDAVSKNEPAAVPAFGIKPLDNQIPGIPNSRKIVRWAFNEGKVGDIDKDIENYGGKYIVAILTKIHKKGYTPFEEVAEDIKLEVIKGKKAELIAAEMQKVQANASSIDGIAQALHLEVNSANKIRFVSFSVPGAGAEPKLIAAALNSETDKITGPIKGENGVYLISVVNKEIREDQLVNLKLAGTYIEKGYSARAARQSFDKLKELVKIKDHRVLFY